MPSYPTRGLIPWDSPLKSYIDSSIPPAVTAAVAAAPTVTAAAAAAVASTVAGQKIMLWTKAPIFFTNYVRNPSAEVDLSDWNPNAGTVERDTSIHRFGVASFKVTPGVNDYSGATLGGFQGLLTAGKPYTIAFWVYTPKALPSVNFGADWMSPGYTINLPVDGYIGAALPIGYTRVILQGIAATTDSQHFRRTAAAGGSTQDPFWIDGVMVIEGFDVPDYFDGDTPGCYWLGTAHASTSVKALHNKNEAVERRTMPELGRNYAVNPEPVTDLTGWVTNLPTPTRVYENNIWWSRTAAGTGFHYARATGMVQGALYAARIMIKGTPGATYSCASTDNVVGQFAIPEIATRRIPPSGIDTVDFLAFAADAGTSDLNFGIQNPSSVMKLSRAQVERVDEIGDGCRFEFFDGYQQGAYWSGAAGSAAVKIEPSATETITPRDLPILGVNLLNDPGQANYFASTNNGTNWTTAADTTIIRKGPRSTKVTLAALSSTATASCYYGDGGSTQAIPTTPGQVYTDHVWVRPDSPGRTAIMAATPFDAAGQVSGGSQFGPSTPLVAGVWNLVSLTYVAAGVFVLPGVNVTAGNPAAAVGEITRLADWGHARGNRPITVIGDDPGAYWQGRRHSSPSVKYALSPAEFTDLTIHGIGSPEGAISAPVGQRYVDDAATAGAVEWTKMAGAGATGWKVTSGDTGWRLMSALLDPDWSASGGWVRLRRTNDTVSIACLGLARLTTFSTIAWDNIMTIPVGFRSYLAGIETPFRYGGAGAYVGVGTQDTNNFQALSNPSISAGPAFNGVFTYTGSQDLWPATLPGTPV